mmetsp:Transcript_10346/g.26053  ORF Transcript_10346/g.26053 Transcript_10346/m.26053 type:complete len:193 (+) Transcript_10346:317-895(+)
MTDVIFAYLWQATLVPARGGVQMTSVAGACMIILSMCFNVYSKLVRDRRAAARELLPSSKLPITPAISHIDSYGTCKVEAARTVRTRIAYAQSGSAAGGGKAEEGPQHGGGARAATGRNANALTQVMMTRLQPVEGSSRRHGVPARASAYSQLAHGGGGDGDGVQSDAESGSDHCSEADSGFTKLYRVESES